jgi:TolA-binding protein
MSSLLRATLITLALLTTAGCTSKPILNTQHDLPADAQVSEEKMKTVIVNALQKREWTVQRLSPQLVQAEITVRNQYYAAIDIRYTRNSYAITYRDSRQLGYKGEQPGQRHHGGIAQQWREW